MSYALVFSGQGMQHAAMLPWLPDSELLAQTRQLLGSNDLRADLAERAWAKTNRNAQVLLTGLALAAWQELSPALPPPAAVAGYSVGELAAFAAATVFDHPAALQLATQRALAMDRCAAAEPGGLLAVSGLSDKHIAELCFASGASLAIHNGSHAHVLGAPDAALDAAETLAIQAGAKCTRLMVGLASHTPWMQAASEEFIQHLSSMPLRHPTLPLFSNALGERVGSQKQALHALAQQISQPVRWSACMEQIHARRVRCVLEIGPGAALARLWMQRYPDIPARSVDEFRSADAILQWLGRCID